MKCIYCSRDSDATFRGVEHVVPQAFGTFGNKTPTLNSVCDDCNSYFGRQLDQLLARDTIEGISRYARGQLSSESRRQKRLQIALAEGPEVGALAGLRVDVDGTTGRLMRPRPQLHAFNFDTGKVDVYFVEQIAGLVLPEASYGKPGKDGAKGTWRVHVLAASKEEHDEFVLALRAAGIPFQAGEGSHLPLVESSAAEELTLPVYVEGIVDVPHKRALAKMLMNFVAWTMGYEEALRPRWDLLRRYVRHAEGEVKFRIVHSPFWNGQETETRRFIDDSIDMRIENLDGNIVGSIQFYARFTYQMILAANDALPAGSEIGYRFTPGSEPVPGQKRAVGSSPTE